MTYDATPETQAHIRRVQTLIREARINLLNRQTRHDLSKLQSPEKEAFDIATPKLRDLTYDSDEYKAALRELGPALEHHYAHNSHHPEHYANGVDGMSLFDVVEMLCDWKAASERHATGDIRKSLEANTARFNLSPQLANILANTIQEMGW